MAVTATVSVRQKPSGGPPEDHGLERAMLTRVLSAPTA
jgi:hypothetical protein